MTENLLRKTRKREDGVLVVRKTLILNIGTPFWRRLLPQGSQHYTCKGEKDKDEKTLGKKEESDEDGGGDGRGQKEEISEKKEEEMDEGVK